MQKGPLNIGNLSAEPLNPSTRAKLALVLWYIQQPALLKRDDQGEFVMDDNGDPIKVANPETDTITGAVAFGMIWPAMPKREKQTFEAYADLVLDAAVRLNIPPFDAWRIGKEVFSGWIVEMLPTPEQATEAQVFPDPARE